MKALSDLIAELGEDPLFIAFMAHCWFAFSVVYVGCVHGYGWPCAGVLVIAAGVKEFWFDATYEHSPPQTFWDNLEDFGGYAIGVLVALWVGAL